MLLLRQSNTMVHVLFLMRLDADGMRNSMFFPILDVITFFPLCSIPLIFLSLESGSPGDKVPQEVKIGNIIVLYNASVTSDVKLFRRFLIVFTLLAAFLHVLSRCVASVKVGSKCTPRYL